MRIKPGLAGLTASHIISNVAGPILRELPECNMRSFIDRSIRGIPKGNAKGKGKKQGAGKGRGGKGKKGGGGRLGVRNPGPPRQQPRLRPHQGRQRWTTPSEEPSTQTHTRLNSENLC